MLSTLNFIVPLGVCTSAISPIFFPINPFPIGEDAEILPAFNSQNPFGSILYAHALDVNASDRDTYVSTCLHLLLVSKEIL